MKIFVLLPRVPFPLEKGDKLRAYNHVKYLSAYNEIHLCALNDTKIHHDTFSALQPFCKSIHILNLPKWGILVNLIKTLFNGKPFQIGYFYNKKNYRKIEALINEIKPDRIFCQLIRVAEYVKCQKIKKTLDYQDVFSKGMERRIPFAPFYLKPLFKTEFKRLIKYEAKIFDFFDNKTIISYPDRDLIQHPEKDKIVVIPNGVDTTFYKLLVREKEFDLLFTGNMGYAPNINSAEFLVKKILPIVVKKYNKIKLLIAGANTSPLVYSLRSENVIVTGWVEDMRECYAKARIFIAPMQIGTGLQNKLLEAMAMQLPCITSILANSALGASNNHEILIGNYPEEYASHIFSLLEDEGTARRIGIQGYQFVINNYNWESTSEKLNRLICS